MEEVKLYKTSWRAIRLLLIIIPFVIVGIILIMKANAQWIGWLSISFFDGLGILKMSVAEKQNRANLIRDFFHH